MRSTSYARLVAWFLEFSHRRSRYPKIQEIEGIQIQCCPQVFNPITGRTTGFFIRHMMIPLAARVLEVGTGSGAIAAAAAQYTDQIIATDISHEAVACAKITMRLNDVEQKVTVLQGDLFDPVEGHHFNVILFNPPYLPLNAKNEISRAWCAGQQFELITRFITEAPKYLAEEGTIEILISTAAPITQILMMIHKAEFQVEILAKGHLLMGLEKIYLLRLRL